MAVSVTEVRNLNKRIEKINTERTKTETRVSMLKDQLSRKLKDYKENYGVDLYSEDFRKLCARVEEETTKVRKEVAEEYEFKEKIVSLIEQGNIDEANKMLGIYVEEPEEAVDNQDASAVAEDDVEEESGADIFRAMTSSPARVAVSEVEEKSDKTANKTGEEDFGFGEGFSFEEDVPVNKESAVASELVKDAPEEENSLFGDLLVDEEDEIDLGNMATASTVASTGYLDEDVDDDHDTGYLDDATKGSIGTFEASNLVVEDDEEDDPFGFGSMLSGGKKF